MRVAFKTVGCKLNQAETARIAAGFVAAGYAVTDWGRPCEVAVVHSCAVTGDAERTSARLARSAARQEPRPFVVLIGCAAEADAARIRDVTGADLIVGQRDKYDLPARLRVLAFPANASKGSAKTEHGLPPDTRHAPPDTRLPCPSLLSRTRAIVKIQDGCDFRCAYCIVPLTRGAPVSRPLPEIVAELEALAENGVREVMLTGVNIGLYRHGRVRLPELLQRIESVAGILRFRIGSLEMSTTEKAVADFMAQSGKLCRYLHFPLQSGDDTVLRDMGRRYAVREWRQSVEYALAKLGTPGLGADIVVGFPGEDRRAFANTLALVRDLPFSNLHVFPFSPRPGTRAFDMPQTVSATEKKERVSRLIALGARKRIAFARTWIGREVSVLIEKREGPVSRGWTSEYVPAILSNSGSRINELARFLPRASRDGIVYERRPSLQRRSKEFAPPEPRMNTDSHG